MTPSTFLAWPRMGAGNTLPAPHEKFEFTQNIAGLPRRRKIPGIVNVRTAGMCVEGWEWGARCTYQ